MGSGARFPRSHGQGLCGVLPVPLSAPSSGTSSSSLWEMGNRDSKMERGPRSLSLAQALVGCMCQGRSWPPGHAVSHHPDTCQAESAMGKLPCLFQRPRASQAGNTGAQVSELYVQIAHISSQRCSQEPEHSLLAASLQEDPNISCRHGEKPALFPIHKGWLQNNTEICHSEYAASVQIGLTA